MSAYAQFDTARKAAFLAAIAYYLTYKVKTKQFSPRDLESAYLRVRDRFRLPREEAAQVVREIETHTGIVAAAANGMFEFVHLSLQEFLCAEYLSRDPHAELLSDYMTHYPAPVAITVALSSNASNAFAALFLRKNRAAFPETKSFLTRLLLEPPFFEVSAALGVAILKLYRDQGGMAEIRDLLEELLAEPSVTESVARALPFYNVRRSHEPLPSGFARLERIQTPKNVPFTVPQVASIPRKLLERIAASGDDRAQSLLQHARDL